MRITTKLIMLSLGIVISMLFISCKDVEEEITEAEEVINIPTNAAEIISVFDKINTQLSSISDLESAKEALHGLEESGMILKKGIDNVGGDKNLETAINDVPELKERFADTMGKLMKQLSRIKAVSPETYTFIDTKLDAILK